MTGLVEVARNAISNTVLDQSITDNSLVLTAQAHYGFTKGDRKKIARAVLIALLPHLSEESRAKIEEELGE